MTGTSKEPHARSDLERRLGAMDVLLVRHAGFRRLADAQGRIDEVPDEAALERARALAMRLASGDARELMLLSSPQARAVATARVLAEGLELPLYVDPDLAEVRIARHPDLDDGATAELWKRVRAYPAAAALPGAETHEAAGARAHAALRSAVRAADGRLVVAMTHGGLMEALLQRLERLRGGVGQPRSFAPLAMYAVAVGEAPSVMEVSET